MKRLLTIIIALCATIASWAYTYMDANGICYISFNSSSKTCSVTFYDNSNEFVLNGRHYTGDIVIPETVEYNGMEYTVNGITTEAFRGCTALNSITIPSSVKSMSYSAFYNCTGLTAVYITDLSAWCRINIYDWASTPLYYAKNLYVGGQLVTHLEVPDDITEIKNYTFEGCSAPTVSIHDGVTSIGEGAFYCSAVQNLDIPSSVQSIGPSAFYCCTALPAITIPDGVPAIGSSTFSGCTSLATVNIPQSVVSIGDYAFKDCSVLKRITLPEGITMINSYTFQNCTSLEEINIPSNVAKSGFYAFANCPSLKTVKITDMAAWCNIDFNGNNGHPFYNMGGTLYLNNQPVTDLVIPDGVTTIKVCAFKNANGIQSVTIPASVRTISSDAFYNCTALNAVHISDAGAWSGITFSNALANPLYYAHNLYLGGSLVTDLVIPDGTTAVKQYAFAGATSFNSITLPASVTAIGSQAFSGATAVTTLNNPTPIDITASGLTSNAVFMVPEGSVAAYQSAWPESYQHRILPIGAQTEFDIESEAVANNSGVMNMINCEAGSFDAMLQVLKLKVKGSINGYDIATFRAKMLNLRELDLSEATIKGDSYNYYQSYHLTDSVLGAYCFNGLTGLKKVTLPSSVKSVGRYAFSGCTSLQEVVMTGDKLTTIDNYAFNGCSALKGVTFANSITSIGSEAFYCCSSLESITLPESLTDIGYEAFEACSKLRTVDFPPHLETIGNEAFCYCYNLESVMLPTTVKTIGRSAFYDCRSLRDIKIPAATATIGESAFYTSSIRDVYTWTIVPTNIGENTFASDTYLYATLHVPDAAQKLYYWSEGGWKRFQKFTKFREPYEYFYLPASDDLVMDEGDPRIEGEDGNNPDVDMNPGSGLVVSGNESQDLGDVNFELNGDGSNSPSIVGGNSTTETSGANVNIDTLHIKITITKNKWYFFAFPFDIEYKNIHFNGQFVWRYYDGGIRAEHGSGAWANHNGTLVRGRGYIFQGSKDGTLTLTVPSASINGQNHIVALESHFSTNLQDASWNLVGNPFTSFYELADLAYNAPVTIWNGSTYVAYNPQDDDLTLHPFQAFFVQKPTDASAVEFLAQFRETKNQSNDPNYRSNAQSRRRARTRGSVQRHIINIEVSDGTVADATRIVFNPQCSDSYEVGCDAAKFTSTEAPQLYSLDAAGTQYAINERPEGDGTVQLGFTAQQAGEFSITATRLDCGMTLIDHLTGTRHNLADGAYSFTASAGTTNARFSLVKTGNEETAIAGVTGVEGAATIYDASGVRRDKAVKGQGVYIVKRGGKAHKVSM